MSGEFANSKLLGALLHIHHMGKSGVLRLQHGTTRKQLVLRDGAVAYAESNRPEEHLARFLVRMSLLERKHLPKVTALMKGGKTSDDAVAAAAGLEAKKILQGAREQAVAILATLLTWPPEEPKFYSNEGLPLRRLNLRMPVPEILVLAARRAASSPELMAALPYVRGVVSPAANRNLAAILPLDGAELYACAQCQAPQPVEELLNLLPAGAAKPIEILRRLLLLGLLTVESAPSAPDAAAAADALLEQIEAQIDDMLAQYEVANYYEILSVPTDAGAEQIHAAYHDLARRYHPDRFESRKYSAALRRKAERLFTFITGAYTTLSDPAARASYDEARKTKESQVEAARQSVAAADVETEKMAEALFNAGCASLASKDYEKAVRQLKESVFFQPNVARYQLYLGVAEAAIPRLAKEAEQHLLRALELDPMRIEGRLELGKLYMRVNLPKRAETQFLEVLRWDPENKAALRLLDEIGRGRAPEGGFLRRPKPAPLR